MKNFFKNIIMAFSMYSTIPMPHIEWDNKKTKYTTCFLPIVGAVCFLLLWSWFEICNYFKINMLISSLIAVAIPKIFSGGLHFDGFLDTCDALFSRRSTEEKLKILKDSACGSFAVLSGVFLILTEFISWIIIYSENKLWLLASFSFILSRIFAAYSVYKFSKARKDGLAVKFSYPAKYTTIILCGFLIISLILLYIIANLKMLLILIPMVLLFIYYYFLSKKNFNGITGDTTGFFIEISQVVSIFMVAFLGGKI